MNHTDPVAAVLRHKGREIFSVPPGTSVYDALAEMAHKGVGALLIMQGTGLQGIISERDYARKVILQGRSSRETTVDEIMTHDLVAVTPQHTVDECMQLMTEYRVRHLPVVDDGRVAGVISMGDLVKYVITAQRDEIEHLHAYIAGGYVS